MEFKNLSIDSELKRFKTHLDEIVNDRLIFSGIFGIGKTYFIQKFFEKNIDEYVNIKLNPVNYSVTSNQDIFELIKYDIAFQLLSQNIDFEKTNFEISFTSQFYVLENYKSIILKLVENLSKLDHQISPIVSSALDLGNKIKKHQLEINKDEKKELVDFLNFFKEEKGSIREDNNVTELLNSLISTLKETKNGKKIVLVIDDLDRIDPEHIFRILNVFSAHFDYQGLVGENKFGFDKIILICDVENIRGIFHNKYGSNIDFSGYIDKFYSTEIYYYEIENIIEKNLECFLRSIKSKQNILQSIKSNDGYLVSELKFLITFFVKSGALSLRILLAFLNRELEIPNYSLRSFLLGQNRVYSHSTPILIVIEFLEKLFGGSTNFLNAIDKVITQYPFLEIEKYGNYSGTSIGNLAMLADHHNSHLEVSKESKTFSYQILSTNIEYEIHWNNNSYGILGKMVKLSPKNEGINTNFISSNLILPYFQLLKAAYLAKIEIVKKYEQ